MPIQTFNYADLGGGLNTGDSPSIIPSKEMTELTNWYPYATLLRRRGGLRRIGLDTKSPISRGTSLFSMKKADGVWSLIIGRHDSFGKLEEGGSVSTLASSYVTPPMLGNTTQPWVFFQYKDYGYALRRDSGQLIRIDVDSISRAGISSPTVAPVMADGGAGALAAGDYYDVYTFYNQQTGIESNPSPASVKLTLGASKRIDHSLIAVSTNPFVNARRIYRTVVGQTGMYYFVTQINNNVDTIVTGEQVLPQDMGRSVSFSNGLPPSGLELGVVWQERLVASDGTNLVYSEFMQVENFGSNLLPIFPDDGHVIRGLHAFGDRLIIGKTNAIHYLVGTDPSNFAVHTLSDKHGVKSHHSMQSAESNLFFYGTGKAVYRSDGTYVVDISTPFVASLLASVPDSAEEYISAATFPELNWYVICLPLSIDGPTEDGVPPPVTPGIVLVYNYKYHTWAVFDTVYAWSLPTYVAEHFTATYGRVLYGLTDSKVIVRYDDTYGYDDSNNVTHSIVATLTTKADDFGYPGYRHFFEEVWLLMRSVPGATLRIEALRDSTGVADVDRTIILTTDPNDWKAFKIPTARTPGSRTWIRVTYTGTTPIDIEQIAFRAGILQRSTGQPR